MNTITEALERLTIVRDAVSDYDGNNKLAGAEAVTAVNTFLIAIVDETDDEVARLLAANSLLIGALLPAMPDPFGERAFSVFVATVDHLIHHFEGVHA